MVTVWADVRALNRGLLLWGKDGHGPVLWMRYDLTFSTASKFFVAGLFYFSASIALVDFSPEEQTRNPFNK